MLCTRNKHSVVGQLYLKNKQNNKLIKKEIRFAVTRGRGWENGEGKGEGELDEVSQKVQTSSYK